MRNTIILAACLIACSVHAQQHNAVPLANADVQASQDTMPDSNTIGVSQLCEYPEGSGEWGPICRGIPGIPLPYVTISPVLHGTEGAFSQGQIDLIAEQEAHDAMIAERWFEIGKDVGNIQTACKIGKRLTLDASTKHACAEFKNENFLTEWAHFHGK